MKSWNQRRDTRNSLAASSIVNKNAGGTREWLLSPVIARPQVSSQAL
jgi:hypothetical protein